MDIFYRHLSTNIPTHVQNRVLTLLGAEPIVIAGAVTNDDPGRNGSFVALSSDLLASVTMTNTPFRGVNYEGWSDSSTVSVRAFRRRSLVDIHIIKDSSNADDSWEELSFPGQWPTGSKLRLTFAGGSVVEVERGRHGEEQGEFLAEVRQDLTLGP